MLIERAGKERTRLTPAGQQFLKMSMRILEIYETMMPQIGQVHKEIQGKISMRSPRNEYSYPLLDYLYEFRRLHPAIDIAMLPWVSADGVRDVVSGAVTAPMWALQIPTLWRSLKAIESHSFPMRRRRFLPGWMCLIRLHAITAALR